MKIVILNDLHPDSNPGAASIAYAFAEEAGKEYETEYWCTEADDVGVREGKNIIVKIRRISKRRAAKMEGNLLHRLYFEVMGFRELGWIIGRIRDSRPTHIWIHQTGTRFPKTIIFIIKLFGISTLVTLHDFGIVFNRKLYPSDFCWSSTEVDQQITRVDSLELKLFNSLSISNAIRQVRRRIVVFSLNRADSVVCISELQSIILKSVGLKVSSVIPNGIKKCECFTDSKIGGFNVLFAGRPNAKGLELLAKAISKQPESHLHLAGGARLVEIASEFLTPSQFTYHGFLNQAQIQSLIHEVQLVSAISQCFDVYPTITLEALGHQTPVITTLLSGNSHLVKDLSKNFIIPWDQVPDLALIMHEIESSKFDFPVICTPNYAWAFYKDIINQIS